MAESLTYCIARGSRVFIPPDWGSRRTAHKALCGKLVRVTSVKAGDIRTSSPVVIIRVRGQQFAAHPKDMKLVGRGFGGAPKRRRKR
jgi:hypothetical protein